LATKFASNWEKCSETFKTLQVAVGEQTLERTQVFEWFSMLKCSVTLMQMIKTWGHLLTSKTLGNLDRAEELVLKNR
jgi:hypothetical protein